MQATEVRVCWEATGIRIRTNATAKHVFTPWTHCNDDVWESSNVLEVFVAPVHSEFDNPIVYHEVDTAPSGALFATLINNPKGNASDCDPKINNCSAGLLPCSGLSDFAPVPLSVKVVLNWQPQISLKNQSQL